MTEIKAVSCLEGAHLAQILNYCEVSDLPIGRCSISGHTISSLKEYTTQNTPKIKGSLHKTSCPTEQLILANLKS